MRRRSLIELFCVSLLACLACQPSAGGKDLRELDAEILAVIDQRLAPIPRFSGAEIGEARFRPVDGCPPVLTRQGSPLRPSDRRQLVRIGRRIERLARRSTPAALRIRALWTLLSEPSPDGRDHMIQLFQAALTREPASASRRNDLAAAYLLRAGLDGRTGDLPEALALLDPVTAGAAPAVPVLLNRAFTLQCLTLWRGAEETWRSLPQGLAAPPEPAPRPASPAEDTAALRRRGEWLLGEWARTLEAREPQSADRLREAEAIGRRLQADGGDGLLSASVGAIRKAEADGDRAALAALARGHAAFHSVRGDAIYSECRSETLRLAETQLAAAGSPFAGWVRVDQAVCAYFDKDFRRAEEILTRLEPEARSHGWLALSGRSEWILGLVCIVQARFVEADRHYARAIQLFSRLREEAHTAYLHSLRAKAFEYGGAREEAWRERIAALRGRGAVRDPERLFTIFNEAAEALQAHGQLTVALSFLSEQMRAAEAGAWQTGKTDLLAYTLLARSRLFNVLGRRAEGAADIAEAERAWSRLSPTNESRPQLRVEIDLQDALLNNSLDHEHVLAAVDRAYRFFGGRRNSMGEQIEVLKLDRLRAQIGQDRGDFATARADLLRGAREIERQRLELATMEDRARFLAQSRGLFVDLVRLELDEMHDPLAALDAFERSSNRVLEDSARAHFGEPAEPLRAELLRTALPPDTLVVRFGHLPDRLLLWTFLDGRMELEQRPLPAAQLVQRVGRCHDLLARGTFPEEREAECDLLAQSLLPRRLRDLPSGRSVLLIPDEVIAPLSFAALRMNPREPYLVERFRLSYAPSLTLLLLAEHSTRRQVPPLRSVLFVSDPAFGSDLFPSLRRLPAARQAVESYARYYPHVEILNDTRATVPATLGALRHADVLHFDGHGLVNSQYPERGGLLLAPADPKAPADASILSAADLPLDIPRHLRLVILGACSTGLTAYRDTAEVTGLAAAFLGRGVPEVVAASWKVKDDAAAKLLDHFHQSLAAGLPTDAALQSAQLALLSSPSPEAASTATWAAFQVFRGENAFAPSVYSQRADGIQRH